MVHQQSDRGQTEDEGETQASTARQVDASVAKETAGATGPDPLMGVSRREISPLTK